MALPVGSISSAVRSPSISSSLPWRARRNWHPVLNALSAHVAAYPPSPLIFTNERGKPIRRSVFSRLFGRAADAAGVPPGTTLHDLRHRYASLLIRHGESVKVVHARLGHASAAETLDTYSYPGPILKTARDRL